LYVSIYSGFRDSWGVGAELKLARGDSLMSVKSLALAAAFCVLATEAALAQKPAAGEPAPTTGRPPLSLARPIQQWPRTLPDAKAAEANSPPGPERPAPRWSEQEIELAQARCKALLNGLAVVAIPETPLHEGAECGARAPMKLVSIGKTPQVAFSPPPLVTCDMIAALYKWLERDLQPLARKYLRAPLVRIETMSSYSCRNAYGRADKRLSEHGRANALDISAFLTANSSSAMVVADWGPTAREIAAQAAAARTEVTEMAGRTAADTTRGQYQSSSAASPPTIIITLPGTTVRLPTTSDRVPGLALAPPNRLGGPKPTPVQQVTANVSEGRMDFLRAAHRAACKTFGTVLGPEANNAHKNHFHVDMAERPRGAICE
jgi:hypothetical protein